MKNRNISVGADHKLHDGLDNEGERGHGHEDRDEGAEELHQGDGGGVPQQDHLRLPECDETTLYNPLDNQRTGTKGLDMRILKLIDFILALHSFSFSLLNLPVNLGLAGVGGKRGRLSRGDLGGVQPC